MPCIFSKQSSRPRWHWLISCCGLRQTSASPDEIYSAVDVPALHHRTPTESPALQTSSAQPSKTEITESNDGCQKDGDTSSSSVMPSDGKTTDDPAVLQASEIALEVGDPMSTTSAVDSNQQLIADEDSPILQTVEVPVRHTSIDLFANRQATTASNTPIPDNLDQQKTAGSVQESEVVVEQSTKEECSTGTPYIQHPPVDGERVTSDDSEKQITSINCKTEVAIADAKTEPPSQSNTGNNLSEHKSDIVLTQELVLRLPADKSQTSPEVPGTTRKTERPPASITGEPPKTPEVSVTPKETEKPEPEASGNLTKSLLPELRLGLDLIPDFKARLGCGSQGSVYMAKLEPSGQTCVLKHFKLKNHCLREAGVLHKMSGIPYFPEIYGTTRNGCIAMEFLGNYNVADALEKVSLQPNDWLEVGLNVATGIQELHNGGLIHGDLKPENVMVYKNRESKWQAKIIDLGMAEPTSPPPVPYQLTPEQIKYCSKMCTHLAPEILDCTKGISVKGDIFSLGVVLYTIGDEAGIVPLQNWAMHCLDPDPASRPNIKWLVSMLSKLKSKWATQ